jgi:HEAT repeats/HEAT repeat
MVLWNMAVLLAPRARRDNYARIMIDYPADILRERDEELELLDIEDIDEDLDLDEDLGSPLDRWVEEPPVAPPDPEVMLEQLRSTDPHLRIAATRAFCEIQDARAIPYLIAAISDPCPLLRVSAAYALGRHPNPAAVAPLIRQLQEDWNGYARKGIVWALGNCHDVQVIAPLIDTLKTDIPSVRLWAASSLAQAAELGYEVVLSVIPRLIEAMVRDEIAAVRSNCAWSIGRLCRELPSNVVYATAVDSLIEVVAEDPELGVRADAKAALLRLGDPRGLQAIEALEAES